MGNSQSSQWDKTLKQQYSTPQHLVHPFLGPISLYFHKETNEEIFMKQIEAPSLGSYDEAKYKQRMNLDDPGFIRVLDVSIKKVGAGSCSAGQPRYLFTGIWQFPGSQTLQNVIDSKNELWPEYKIWQIANILIERCSILEGMNQSHTDIRPKNLFIKDDQIIFAEPTAIPGIGSAYKKAMDGDQPYLSPQQMEDLKTFKLLTTSDPVKNDVYSLGMTILNCMTLQSCQKFYDYDTFNLRFVQLKQCFSQLPYSQGLKNFVEYLLTFAENERPTFLQIQSILEPVQNDIKNTKDFFTRKTFINGRFESISQINVNPLLRSINLQRRQSYVASLAPETRSITPTKLKTQPSMITTPVRIQRGRTPSTYNNSMRMSVSPLLVRSRNLLGSTHHTPIRMTTDDNLPQFIQPTLDQKIQEALKASQKVLDKHQQQQRQPN